jgi:hypothetical protein
MPNENERVFMGINNVVLLLMADALLLGCTESGYDLEFVMPVSVEQIELTMDKTGGVEPENVGNNTYRIELDDEGKARIPSDWPIRTFHRTFIVTPQGRMQENMDFRFGQSRWKWRYSTERTESGVTSKNVLDGSVWTIPIVEWTELNDCRTSNPSVEDR